MFRIGDFSKLTRVTVKMLRHYDEIGLLRPAYVEPGTGYRYYQADQLPRLNRIIALKDLGFALEQIATLLDQDLALDEIRGMLKLRHAEIVHQIELEQQRLAQIEVRLAAMSLAAQQPHYDVVLRAVAAQQMATIRQTVPTLGQPITQLFDTLEAYVAQQHARAVGSPLTIFHDQEYREHDLEIEVAVPVTHTLPPHEQIVTREVVGAPHMACVVYTGTYDHMPEVLHTLLRWIAAHEYAIAGPLREVYLRFGADKDVAAQIPQAFLTDQSQLFVTEVQIPVTPHRRSNDAVPIVGS